MVWENIEERLKRAFKVKVVFPAGTIWLPDAHQDVDEWLTSMAETDEELRELDIPRMRFLRNRWPVEKLIEVEWDEQSSDRRTIWAMYVGTRAYILFSWGGEYQLIAAIEPKSKPALYRAVIGELLQNPNFVPERANKIKNYRPDLVPDALIDVGGSPVNEALSTSSKIRPKRGYLSKLLVGWIGEWLDLPVLGFWHEDIPESISTSRKGNASMKYKPTYGDKQREKQRRQKKEALRNPQPPTEASENEVGGKAQTPEGQAEPKDKKRGVA